MGDVPQPIQSERTGPPAHSRGRLAYQAPLLRSHGTLRDLTSQIMSGQKQASDVNRKENVVPLAWH